MKWPEFNYRLDQRGFTLIELVIVIVTLGILAAVAVPKFSDLAKASKINAAKQELDALRKSIIGNPSAVAGGKYIDRGFEGDCGFVPSRLEDLAIRPGSLSVYDPLTRLGWNGPYIDTSQGAYLLDPWDNSYIYQPGLRTIFSSGGSSDTVRVTF